MPASDKATAPLATAAAAIAAASSATGNAATGAPTPAGTETGATATATVAEAAGAKIDAQAAAAEAVGAQGTAADATMPNGISVAASATPQLTPKTATTVKGPVFAKEGTTLPGESNGANGTTEAAASSTPNSIVPGVNQPDAVSGKPKAQDGAVYAMKADASNNAAPDPVANAAANAHAAAADAAQTLANPPDAGTQAASAIQPQLSSAPTAPTPTTQLTVTAATHAAVPLSGLAMEIAASAKSGKSRFEIRLDPAELGRIDVRIDVDRNGQVTSHLTVDRPETLSMLRQDATQLQRALDNAGLQTGNGGLQFSLRDQSSQGQNDGSQSNPNAHRLIVTEEETIPATVAGRSYGRTLGTSGGVDIRV
jgi:flagellar hook-length control protein FliK